MAYTSSELQHAAMITSRQLHYWARAGWLVPYERPEKSGSGVPLEWSWDAMRKARLMRQLTTAGFMPLAAHEIATAALKDGFFPHTIRIGQNVSITIHGALAP